MGPIEAGRATRRYTQHIEAPPARVFPLLCPVREAEWLDGWVNEIQMIHSDSGLAEEGCVFRTRPPGGAETVWMITRHDPAEGIVEFVRVTAGLLATRLRMSVEPATAASSRVHITYTFTPLGVSGVAFLRETHSEEAFRRDMTWWEDSMNHWLRSGETLRPPSPNRSPVPRP